MATVGVKGLTLTQLLFFSNIVKLYQNDVVQTTLDSETQEPQDELTSTAVTWFQSVGVDVSTVSDVLSSDDERIMQSIQDGITRANQRAISRAQNVQKWRILPRHFSIVNGDLGT